MKVVHINDYQKQRFVERMIEAMFNTISGKKIAVLGFAFKKVLPSGLAGRNESLPSPGSASARQHDNSMTIQHLSECSGVRHQACPRLPVAMEGMPEITGEACAGHGGHA